MRAILLSALLWSSQACAQIPEQGRFDHVLYDYRDQPTSEGYALLESARAPSF